MAGEKEKKITSIKAFDHNLACRGFQFEVGKTYTVEGKIIPCENGFHAVDISNPFHAWDFYPVVDESGRLTRYAEVEQSGEIVRQDDEHKRGSKIASAEIAIKAEIALLDFIRRAVDAVISLTKGKNDDGVIGSSGDSARIGSSGDSARIGSSGYSARIVAEGKDSVIASAGRSATVTAADGAWISVAEYDDTGKCVGFATGCIGKGGLKPNTPYIAKNGKLVEPS